MSVDNSRAIDNHVFQQINWSKLTFLAEQHGLMPLLYQYLNENHRDDTPSNVITDLEHRYKANELRNRVLTQELLGLMDYLNERGITALAYKGPTLTISLYGDLALRQFGDLDILIHTDDVLTACSYLNELGYQRTIPILSATKEKDFIRTDHEHEFVSADNLINIDLHWELSTQRFPFYMQTTGLFERSESLGLPRGKLDHISAQDLLLLLCMHSNKDLWRKLIWVCDIDRLIRTRKNIDWHRLKKQAAASHCESMFFTSLLISHSLLNTPLPPFIMDVLQAPRYQSLAESAMDLCTGKFNEQNFTQCLAIHPFISAVCDTRYDRIQYIYRSLVTPNENDMMQYNLPSWLHGLYYVVRPTRNLTFCFARTIKRFLTN